MQSMRNGTKAAVLHSAGPGALTTQLSWETRTSWVGKFDSSPEGLELWPCPTVVSVASQLYVRRIRSTSLAHALAYQKLTQNGYRVDADGYLIANVK